VLLSSLPPLSREPPDGDCGFRRFNSHNPEGLTGSGGCPCASTQGGEATRERVKGPVGMILPTTVDLLVHSHFRRVAHSLCLLKLTRMSGCRTATGT
jgi:hypothetical protein